MAEIVLCVCVWCGFLTKKKKPIFFSPIWPFTLDHVTTQDGHKLRIHYWRDVIEFGDKPMLDPIHLFFFFYSFVLLSLTYSAYKYHSLL